MRILFLAEGDSETWDAWSGSAKSLVDRLRDAGQQVETADVDLYGVERATALLSTFAPSRARWRMKYRFEAEGPFRRRSRRAAKHIRRAAEQTEVIVQIGPTFAPIGRGNIPYAVVCDSNIAMARRGAATGYSAAVPLSERELDRIAAREKRVYDSAILVFSLSELLRRSFIDDFGLEPERVVTINGGPNFQTTDLPQRQERPESRTAPTVLFVGRNFLRKGGDLLIAAFRIVRRELPEARLLIAGTQEPFSQDAGIEWLGDLDKEALGRLYASARVFCLPTRFEPYGVSYLEAMHFGLPCVGTNVWAVPEMIVDGETGYLVPVDDPEVLAERLLRLLADPEAAARMGAAGRARAAREFTWEAAVSRMMKALDRVLERTR